MATEEKKQEEHPVLEKLEAVGQAIVGEIEKIGGVLTGDPLTQAEGDFNLSEGLSHLKESETPSDKKEEKPSK